MSCSAINMYEPLKNADKFEKMWPAGAFSEIDVQHTFLY